MTSLAVRRGGVAFMIFLLATSGCTALKWTMADTIRQGTYIGLLTVDYIQTRRIATEMVPEQSWSNPDGSGGTRYAYPKWKEMNPILGEHPSSRDVDGYFAASAAINTAIAIALPPKYRHVFQYISIGWEGAFVTWNFGQGIRP